MTWCQCGESCCAPAPGNLITAFERTCRQLLLLKLDQPAPITGKAQSTSLKVKGQASSRWWSGLCEIRLEAASARKTGAMKYQRKGTNPLNHSVLLERHLVAVGGSEVMSDLILPVLSDSVFCSSVPD